jgi:hypothetical protein
MTRAQSGRRGVALVAALLMVALLGLLTAGIIAAAGRLRDGSGLAQRDAELVAAAEYALNSTVVNWNGLGLAALTVGMSQSLTVSVPGSPFTVTVSAIRLQSALYWIVADVPAADSSHRRLNLIVRSGAIDLDSIAPIVSAGNVSITAPAIAIGVTAATAATCSAAAEPAIVLGPAAQLTWAAADSSPVLAVVRQASAAYPASYSHVGGSTWAQLQRAAAIVLPPSATIQVDPTAACTEGSAVDWGDPRTGAAASCAQFIPLIVATGDVVVTGGVGQGMLLVQGHLHIEGPFEFTGVIVALNGIQSDADGVTIDGALISGTATGTVTGAVQLSGHATVMGDPCTVQRIVASAVPPRAVGGRAWAELY